MPDDPTIYYCGQDDAVRRFLVFLAPSLQARSEARMDAVRLLNAQSSTLRNCMVIDANDEVEESRSVLQMMAHRGACLPVIAVGDGENGELQSRWQDAGAVAYVPVDDSPLLRTAVAEALGLARAHERVHRQLHDFRRRLAALSPKQRRVLNALIRGGSNKQIAVDHGVSERTLERRRAELVEELNVRSMIEAAWWYGRSDVPEPGQPFRWPPLSLDDGSERRDLDDEDSAVIVLAEVQSGRKAGPVTY